MSVFIDALFVFIYVIWCQT